MRELLIISGEGGTGKTNLTASFAVLADRPAVADYSSRVCGDRIRDRLVIRADRRHPPDMGQTGPSERTKPVAMAGRRSKRG